MKKFALFIWVIFIFITDNVIAQGELQEQSEIFYRNERTFAVLINSNGYGVNYRYGKRLTAFKKTLYDFDFVGIKHPREQKITADYFNRFVYGKMNDFYNLRGGIGLEKELFSKVDRGGISVRWYYSGGLNFGLAKPIYYNFSIGNGIIEQEKFDPNNHPDPQVIRGKASFFKGIFETSVIPGLYCKSGIIFEFGKVDEIIHALDAGITVDAFVKKVEIMSEDNNRFFLTLFFSYRFGKVIDSRFKQNRNKIDEILTQ